MTAYTDVFEKRFGRESGQLRVVNGIAVRDFLNYANSGFKQRWASALGRDGFNTFKTLLLGKAQQNARGLATSRNATGALARSLEVRRGGLSVFERARLAFNNLEGRTNYSGIANLSLIVHGPAAKYGPIQDHGGWIVPRPDSGNKFLAIPLPGALRLGRTKMREWASSETFQLTLGHRKPDPDDDRDRIVYAKNRIPAQKRTYTKGPGGSRGVVRTRADQSRDIPVPIFYLTKQVYIKPTYWARDAMEATVVEIRKWFDRQHPAGPSKRGK